MDLSSKFRETVISVLPIMAIVLLLRLFAVPGDARPPYGSGYEISEFALGSV